MMSSWDSWEFVRLWLRNSDVYSWWENTRHVTKRIFHRIPCLLRLIRNKRKNLEAWIFVFSDKLKAFGQGISRVTLTNPPVADRWKWRFLGWATPNLTCYRYGTSIKSGVEGKFCILNKPVRLDDSSLELSGFWPPHESYLSANCINQGVVAKMACMQLNQVF